MKDSKDTDIRFRIEKELKEQFKSICDTKAINSSALLRQFIISWIAEQHEKDTVQTTNTN